MLHDMKVARSVSDRVERRGLMQALDKAQALVWFDQKGMIVDANDNTKALLGYGFNELRALTLADLSRVKVNEAQAFARTWVRILKNELRNEERSLYTRDGEETWCSINYAAIENDEGKVRRVLAIVINLSPWSWKPNDASRMGGL